MVFPKARLAVSAVLFLAWIGFLVSLVYRTRDPVILSRPQLVVADLVVFADVSEQGGRPLSTVTVKKVAWKKAGEVGAPAGSQLKVEGLADCDSPQAGWEKPGAYILPLTKRGDSGYEVTPLPLSPGYVPEYVTIDLVRVGPEKEKVAELVAEILGSGDKKGAVSTGILRRNVSRQKAEDFKKKLEAAKANVRLSEGEARIYRATPDALEQLEELRPKSE